MNMESGYPSNVLKAQPQLVVKVTNGVEDIQ